MNNFSNYFEVQDVFARLFVLAIQNDFHPNAFTYLLERSEFVNYIENGKINELFDLKIESLFKTITSYKIETDTSFGIYNDAYWCGYSYFEIFIRSKKPFSYIFLKLPFSDLLSLYPVYHEMDISSLLEYFHDVAKKKTIIRSLVESNKTSLNKLSKELNISVNTLIKYNIDDKYLYRGSFQTLSKLVNIFNLPYSLFIEETGTNI